MVSKETALFPHPVFARYLRAQLAQALVTVLAVGPARLLAVVHFPVTGTLPRLASALPSAPPFLAGPVTSRLAVISTLMPLLLCPAQADSLLADSVLPLASQRQQELETLMETVTAIFLGLAD